MKIKLSEPFFDKAENKILKKCIDTKWISSSGPMTKIFEKKIANYLKIKHVLGIINCTSALQLSIKLLKPNYQDEIIVPSITFVATANSIIYNSCNPIFIDCDNKFLIDTKKVLKFLKEKTITKNGKCFNKKTKKRIIGLILVHTFGNLVNINTSLIKECKKRNIKIIEDSAESLGSFYIDRLGKKHSGTVGDLGCLSFNGNKIITTGGGGAIVFKNLQLFKKANYLAAQAKDDSTYFIHNDVGYNFKISNLHSAIGIAQFSKLKSVLKKKETIHKLYKKELNKIEGLKILNKPNYCKSNFWLNILIIEEKKYGLSKDKIIELFKNRNVETRSVWYPNHLQKPFKKFENYQITKSYKMFKTSLCLPSSFNLNLKKQKIIINLLKNKFK